MYSIADNDVLVRNGTSYDTMGFLDVYTSWSLLLAVFHIPQTGLTTVLQLSADTDGYAVRPKVRFVHFSFLSWDEVWELWATTGLLLFTCFCVFAFNLLVLLRQLKEDKLWNRPTDIVGIVEVVIDCAQAMVVLIVSLIFYSYFETSETRAFALVGNIAKVPFASANVTFSEKKSTFFGGLDALTSTLNYEDSLSSFAYFVFIALLVRIIYATSVHPRTGMLTGTISHGFNDFMHFALLFLIVYIFFAFTATWMFGSTSELFADVQKVTQI